MQLKFGFQSHYNSIISYKLFPFVGHYMVCVFSETFLFRYYQEISWVNQGK